MKLEGFRFRHLGPFGARGVSVDGLLPGLNVVAERNERGKSSLLAGLTLLLFRPHTSWDREVRGLTHGEGAPHGEVDFSHQGQSFRLQKQFRTGRTATLLDRDTGAVVARKGEAEERLKAMLGADGKQHGPSGLLWVRQGKSMHDVRDDGHVAARLETELTTLVGGDRARDYLAQTTEQLGELRTKTGKSKKGGPLQLAEDELASARDALDAARTAARDMRDTGRQLGEVRAQLAALDGADANDADAQLAEARDALAAAQTARAVLDAAQSAQRSAEAEAEHTRNRLEGFLAACAERDRFADELAALEGRIAEAERADRDARQTLDEANAAVAELQGAQARAASLQQAQSLRERISDRNAALQSLLATMEAAQTAAREVDALVEQWDALPAIAAHDVDGLVALQRARDAAQAGLERVEVALELVLERGTTAIVDGEAVTSGVVVLGASTTLTLPGHARLRLAVPEAESARAELDAADAALAAGLERLEVDSVEAAATGAAGRADVAAELSLARKQLALIAPDGLDALAERRAALEADMDTLASRLDALALDDIDADEDFAAAAARLAEANGRRNAAQTALGEAQAALATLRERRTATRRQLSAQPGETETSRRAAHQAKLAATDASAQARLQAATDTLDAQRARAPEDPAMAAARVDRLQTFARNRAAQRSALLTRQTELETMRREAFERRDPDMEAKRLEGVVERLEDEVARHTRRADALALLRDTLASSQRTLRDAYTAPVRRELLPLLRQVIDGADLEMSEDLGPTALLRDGAPDALERLSGGTREQIAVLTRLAFARLLARGGQPTPVILDDALVYADDSRRARMFDVLNYVATGDDGLQLLYLSCHADATARLGGHRLTLSDWPESG